MALKRKLAEVEAITEASSINKKKPYKERPLHAISPSWKYFMFKDATEKHVICKKCKAQLIYHGSTSTMNYHIKNSHPVASDVSPLNSRLTAYFRPARILSPKEKTVRRVKCLKWIVTNLRPFSIVEDANLAEYLQDLDAGAKCPTRRTLMKELNVQYEELQLKLKNLLSGIVSGISLTADMWTSAAKEGYLAVTVHWISPEWQMKKICTGVIHVPGSHTGASISNQIRKNQADLSFGANYAVTDSGANMIAAFDLLPSILHIPCFIHKIQLVLKAALPEDCNMLKKCRKLVGLFNHSTQACDALKRMQISTEEKVLNLIQDVKTRWNSTYLMLARLLDVKTSMVALFSTSDLNSSDHFKKSLAKYVLDADDWRNLEGLVKIWEPFKDLTDVLEGEGYPTLSYVYGLHRVLIANLNLQANTFKDDNYLSKIVADLITQLVGSWKKVPVKLRRVLFLAAVLDPRIKGLRYLEGKESFSVWAMLKEEYESKKLEMEEDGTLDVEIESGQSVPTNVVIPLFEPEVALDEISSYKLEKPIPYNKRGSALEWWKGKELIYPVLSTLAKMYLSIPASSAPVERVFSHAGILVSDRRASLATDSVEKVLFLYENQQFW